MATTQTNPQTKIDHDTQQSVYIADQDKIKLYPRSMSNDEIDFDIHTTVRNQTPEDYYVNFKPLIAIQQGFKEIVQGPMGSVVEMGAKVGKEAVKYQDETITPAFKYAITGELEKAYKPWLDIWRESIVGKKASGYSDVFLVHTPAPIAAIPWFVAEFVPEQLIEFGTKPLNWVGAYGIEKFGPPIINKLIQSKFNKEGTAFFSKIFKGEMELKAEFEILGISPNAKTSEVVNARNNAAKYTHPDAGGTTQEFNKVQTAYESIMKSRGGVYDKFLDMFRESKLSKPKPTKPGLLGNQSGSVLIPFSKGDLVKMGKDVGQVVKISGEIAAVNIAGKVMEVPLSSLKPMKREPTEPDRRSILESLVEKKDLTYPKSQKEVDFISKNLDAFDEAYNKKIKKEYKSDNPNIISSDVGRVIEVEGRGKLTNQGAAERHAGSSAYSKMRYAEALADPALFDKDVTLMAGVSGAGKTGAIRKLASKSLADDIIYDTNVASVESGKRIIDQALKSNTDRNVHVFYVDRDPVVAFEEGVIPRYLDLKGDRRVLPIEAHLNNIKSKDSVLELMEIYKGNSRVKFQLVGNYGKKGDYTHLSVDELKSKVYNSKEIGAKLEKGIQEKLNAGILTPEAAAAFLGKSASEQGVLRKSDGVPDWNKKTTEVSPATQSAVNPSNLKVSDDAKLNLIRATDQMKEEIQNQTGKPMTHEEVIEKAKEAEIISKGVSREATLEFQASLLKTRQHLAALAEQNELTPEFLDTLKVMSNLGTDIARNLESFKIEAMPEYATAKIKVIKDIQKLGVASEDILKAAQEVDFQSEQSVAKFYRQFVKPTLPEILDEFVYMNILSSPITHIKNALSNIVQLSGLNPLTKLASGSIDYFASKLTGQAREYYVSEIPDFYKGAINAFPKAIGLVSKIMSGEKNLERPDVKHLPTLSPLVDWATLKLGKYVTRALEASDVLFRTMIEGGEVQALSKKLGHEPSAKELAKINKEAGEIAEHYVFRSKPDAENKTGQGNLLSAIDKMTNAIYRLREVPGLKWFIRFVQTPMNIAKQGIEYSPAGFATLPGASNKSEQAGKAAIGSIVFAGAGWLAANGSTTWSAPTGAQDKNDFYAAGLQPYSVRIGDTWVSYAQIGPLAYPVAMAAALHYFTKESPDALSDSEMDKITDSLGGVMGFFSDQSYMQGLGDLVKAAQGEKSRAVASAPTQLVPLSSLQGWVNNIIDPLQRKAEKGLSLESVLDNIQMKIVGMSKFVPAQIDVEEVSVKKQMRAVNAVSPVRVSKVNKGKLSEYKETQEMKRLENKDKKDSQ